MLIPNRLKEHFKIACQNEDGTIISGRIKCCMNSDFAIWTVGDIRKRLFKKLDIYPLNNQLKLVAECTTCKKRIIVFDSLCDGYEPLSAGIQSTSISGPLHCEKCGAEGFSVQVRYEYPSEEELRELGISHIDTAFTWIWGTLICNTCGKHYTNFLDCETD